jgi:hypothetical protein
MRTILTLTFVAAAFCTFAQSSGEPSAPVKEETNTAGSGDIYFTIPLDPAGFTFMDDSGNYKATPCSEEDVTGHELFPKGDRMSIMIDGKKTSFKVEKI